MPAFLLNQYLCIKWQKSLCINDPSINNQSFWKHLFATRRLWYCMRCLSCARGSLGLEEYHNSLKCFNLQASGRSEHSFVFILTGELFLEGCPSDWCSLCQKSYQCNSTYFIICMCVDFQYRNLLWWGPFAWTSPGSRWWGGFKIKDKIRCSLCRKLAHDRSDPLSA